MRCAGSFSSCNAGEIASIRVGIRRALRRTATALTSEHERPGIDQDVVEAARRTQVEVGHSLSTNSSVPPSTVFTARQRQLSKVQFAIASEGALRTNCVSHEGADREGM
jgi:hypothetical protein